jgi:hypothetical protein
MAYDQKQSPSPVSAQASAAVGRLSATGMMWSACSMSRRCGQWQRGGGAMPDVNAMMRTAMSGRGGYQAMAQPSQSDDGTYLCVADVLVTEQSKNSPAGTYKMRSVAHVLQKKLNIHEATPIIREKFVASVTGAFSPADSALQPNELTYSPCLDTK